MAGRHLKRGKALFANRNAAGRHEQPIADAASSREKDTGYGISRFGKPSAQNPTVGMLHSVG
jgi:hypothetical protein